MKDLWTGLLYVGFEFFSLAIFAAFGLVVYWLTDSFAMAAGFTAANYVVNVAMRFHRLEKKHGEI